MKLSFLPSPCRILNARSLFLRLLTGAFLLMSVSGCSLSKLFPKQDECNFRTSLDLDFASYLSSENYKNNVSRLGIISFDVQESFSSPAADYSHYGRELSQALQQQLLASEEIGIVEMFEQANWPGRREEFYQGNQQAIRLGNLAQYDFILVGLVKPLVIGEALRVHTKIIDVNNAVTIFSAEGEIGHKDHAIVQAARGTRTFFEQPEIMNFRHLSKLHAQCLVHRIFENY